MQFDRVIQCWILSLPIYIYYELLGCTSAVTALSTESHIHTGYTIIIIDVTQVHIVLINDNSRWVDQPSQHHSCCTVEDGAIWTGLPWLQPDLVAHCTSWNVRTLTSFLRDSCSNWNGTDPPRLGANYMSSWATPFSYSIIQNVLWYLQTNYSPNCAHYLMRYLTTHNTT